MQDEDKFPGRVARMISRWAGQRLTFTRKTTTEGEVLQHTPPAPGEMDADKGVYIEAPKALPILAECEVLVVGDQVFTTGSIGRGTNLLQCLDITNGKQRWKFLAPLAQGDATPAWDGGRLYLQARGQVACHNAKNGELLWQVDPKKLLAETGVVATKIPTPCYSGTSCKPARPMRPRS